MASNLFLNVIQNSKRSGSVQFLLPNPDYTPGNITPVELKGWLAENPSISLGNNWQPIIPAMEELTKISNIVTVSQDVVTWLGGSQSAWTGSEYLDLPLTFYLFSIDEKSKIKKEFMKMASLTVINTTDASATQGTVHGGYKPDIVGEALTIINNKTRPGFITINIGGQLTFPNMLLVSINCEPSMIEVKDGNPLYIKINAKFKSYRPYTYNELKQIIITNPSI